MPVDRNESESSVFPKQGFLLPIGLVALHGRYREKSTHRRECGKVSERTPAGQGLKPLRWCQPVPETFIDRCCRN